MLKVRQCLVRIAYLLGNRRHIESFSARETSYCIADTIIYESKIERRPLPEPGNAVRIRLACQEEKDSEERRAHRNDPVDGASLDTVVRSKVGDGKRSLSGTNHRTIVLLRRELSGRPVTAENARDKRFYLRNTLKPLYERFNPFSLERSRPQE